MNAEIVLIVAVILASVMFVIFLMSRNAKDKVDISPDLTEELEKKKKAGQEIK